MKAITVEPLRAASIQLSEVPEPDPHDGAVLVEAIAVGVCGTDAEIVDGKYGWAAPGNSRLVLGHESLGRVLDPGSARSLKAGDLIAGIVRRPDPIPCPNCAVGEWDMCSNGLYTERGIKEIDGFMSERWRIEPEYAIRVDPALRLLGVLLEPTAVVTKAWEQVFAVGRRAFWEPRTALITGAGPIGLLAALLAKEQGLDVHVLDRVESGPKPELVHDLGATYHHGLVADIGFSPDVIIECTGVGEVIAASIKAVARGGVVCLAGVGREGDFPSIPNAEISSELVLGNKILVGSVNANKRHWYKGAEALTRADRSWLSRLITRREEPKDFANAFKSRGLDIKVVIQFSDV